MKNDYFNAVYKQRIEYAGVDRKDKIVNDGIRKFERYLQTIPTREVIKYGDYNIIVSIQTSSQSELGDRYEKIILAPLDSELDVGSIFKWKNSYWIIVTKDIRSIETHVHGKIRQCNSILKWNDEVNVIQTPAHVVSDKGIGLTEGIKQGIIFSEPSLNLYVVVPWNNNTKQLKREQRFIIQSQAWKITSIDDVSTPNLRIIRMIEDSIDPAIDDVDGEIANIYIPEEETGIEEYDGIMYTIEGKSSITWSQTEEYTAKTDETIAGNVLFSIIDGEELVTLNTDSEQNPAEITANNDGKVGTVLLEVNFQDQGVSVTKEINVISFWG